MKKRLIKSFNELSKRDASIRRQAVLFSNAKEDKACPTIGVGFEKEKFFLVYNKEFLNTVCEKDLCFLIMHETLHVVLEHHARYKQHVKQQNNQSMVLWNIVADAYINQHLIEKGYGTRNLIKDCWTPRQVIDMDSELTLSQFNNSNVEDIFDILWKEKEKQDEKAFSIERELSSKQQEKLNIQNSSSISEKEQDISSSSGSISRQLSQEKKKYKQEISIYEKVPTEKTIVNPAKEYELIQGLSIDWRTLLKKLVSSTGKLERKKSYRRPNKRYRDIYPISQGKIKEGVKDIIVSIDISASMNQKKINKALTALDELSTIYSVDFDYFFFSSESGEIYSYQGFESLRENLKKYEQKSTDWYAATNPELINNYESLIVLSDMGFDQNVTKEMINKIKPKHLLLNVEQI